jgi:NitT/TauT family transport system permease protein
MRASLKALTLPVALLVAAEAAVRISGTTSQAVAAPTAVAVALVEALSDGSMLVATRDTLLGAFAGLALGSVLGLALGILLGLVKPLDRLMEVTIEAVRPIPSVAVIPIAMLALGFGYGMEIAIVAFACLWPMLILSRSAITGIEPRLLEVARALRLSPLQRVFKIVLPAALPRIIVAFRLAAGIALVVAVTVEIAANPLGLGYGILIAQQSLRPELMLAYLLWIGVVGFLVNALLAWAQGRLFGRAALAAATS